MPSAAGALVGGSVISGLLGADAAGDAASTQSRASQAGIAEQRRQFDTILNLLAPQRRLSDLATNQIANLFFGQNVLSPPETITPQAPSQQLPESVLNRLRIPFINPVHAERNLPPGMQTLNSAQIPPLQNTDQSPTRSIPSPVGTVQPTKSQAVTPENFLLQDPGFNFRLNTGLDQLQGTATGRGDLFSGQTLKDLETFRQDLASQEFGNALNRLFGVAGLSQPAISQSVGAAGNTGNAISSLLQQGGAAQAAGIQGQNSAFQNTFNNLGLIGLLNNQGLL